MYVLVALRVEYTLLYLLTKCYVIPIFIGDEYFLSFICMSFFRDLSYHSFSYNFQVPTN